MYLLGQGYVFNRHVPPPIHKPQRTSDSFPIPHPVYVPHVPSLAGDVAPLAFPKKSVSARFTNLQEEYERNLLWLHSIDPTLFPPCEFSSVLEDAPSHINHVYLPWQLEIVRQLENSHHHHHQSPQQHAHHAPTDAKEKEQHEEAEKRAKLQQQFLGLMNDDAKFAYLAATQPQRKHVAVYPFLRVHTLQESADQSTDQGPSTQVPPQPTAHADEDDDKKAQPAPAHPHRRRADSSLSGSRVRSHSAPSTPRGRRQRARRAIPAVIPISVSLTISASRHAHAKANPKPEFHRSLSAITEADRAAQWQVSTDAALKGAAVSVAQQPTD